MASGQIYIPPETYVLGEILSRWRKWRGLTWREQVWLFCAYFDRHNMFDDFEISSFSPLAKEALEFDFDKRTLEHLIDRFYAFMAREHGFTEQRWGDKTPWNTMHLKDIVRAYPDAYYLYLKRDGRDVVASQLKSDMRDFDSSVQRWIDANTSCRKHLKKARRTSMEVSYEDLVTDPEAVFQNIFAWAELDYHSDYLTKIPERLGDVGRHDHHAAVTRPITANSIGKWKESLAANAFNDAQPAFADMMRRLGYEL